uniref:Uncharacterized protein n=1 Tax=Hucho hucho TaxID=62062 RepID=A0A4W5NNJ6_9TELE
SVCFSGSVNFCYECGDLLPLPKLQETVFCFSCEEGKMKKRKVLKRMRNAEVEVEFDEDGDRKRDGGQRRVSSTVVTITLDLHYQPTSIYLSVAISA